MNDIDQIANKPGLARAEDPQTSKRAAQTISNKAKRLWAVVDVMIEAHPQGLTQWEMEQRTGDPNVRTRCRELEKAGWFERSGEQRPGQLGQPADVWILTEGALDYYG